MTLKRDFCPEMLSALQNANSILLCTHVSPDGDAVGASLAMYWALKGMGKQPVLALDGPVPRQFRFLPGADEIIPSEALEGRAFDTALAIDAARAERLGGCGDAYFSAPVTLQMDHHPGNPLYAQINVVDEHACAAGCVVFRCLKALGVQLTKEIAACLYCAVSTDTGNFCYLNTNAEAFFIMAELMENGLDFGSLVRPLHQLREEPAVRLLGKALASLQVFAGGKCACMTLTKEDYQTAKALPEHNAAIVNYALDMPGVEIAFLAEERESGEVKASLRSLPPWNVGDVARKYNGGGHALAAGLRFGGTLQELTETLKKELQGMVGEA